ncbi:MAG: hypothetical protein EOO44_01385 [Flavobacterium sp.]|nr:MAG: hypothetical protein EOO44_01385 [Flavobacterium sp.]
MRSKLNISQFRERFKDNTKIGSPLLKLSPFGILNFGGFSKPFYGDFDNSVFRLTANSSLSPTFYIIKGKYKVVNGILKIEYSNEPRNKFQLVWIKYFPVIALVAMNLLFLMDKKAEIEFYIVSNLSIIFVLFFSRWNTRRKKENLEQKFKEVFEITD